MTGDLGAEELGFYRPETHVIIYVISLSLSLVTLFLLGCTAYMLLYMHDPRQFTSSNVSHVTANSCDIHESKGKRYGVTPVNPS